VANLVNIDLLANSLSSAVAEIGRLHCAVHDRSASPDHRDFLDAAINSFGSRFFQTSYTNAVDAWQNNVYTRHVSHFRVSHVSH